MMFFLSRIIQVLPAPLQSEGWEVDGIEGVSVSRYRKALWKRNYSQAVGMNAEARRNTDNGQSESRGSFVIQSGVASWKQKGNMEMRYQCWSSLFNTSLIQADLWWFPRSSAFLREFQGFSRSYLHLGIFLWTLNRILIISRHHSWS